MPKACCARSDEGSHAGRESRGGARRSGRGDLPRAGGGAFIGTAVACQKPVAPDLTRAHMRDGNLAAALADLDEAICLAPEEAHLSELRSHAKSLLRQI